MTDLARKLGPRSGQRVCLLDAPLEAATLIDEAALPDVAFTKALAGVQRGERFDAILFWPIRRAGLVERFADLRSRIESDGAIGVVIPKKPFARDRGLDFDWDDLQQATLQTDLVDNKTASSSEKEYGIGFVIRRIARGRQQT